MPPSASRICARFFTVSAPASIRQRAFHFSRSAQVALPCFPACPALGNMSTISICPLGIHPSICEIFHRMESIQGSLSFFHAHSPPVTPSSPSIPFLDPAPVWSPQVKPFPDPRVLGPPKSRHSSKPRWVDGPVLAQHGSAHVNSLDEAHHHRLGHSSRFRLGNIKRVIQLYHRPIHQLSLPSGHLTYLAFEAHSTLLHPSRPHIRLTFVQNEQTHVVKRSSGFDQ